jgi:hypothetical protein
MVITVSAVSTAHGKLPLASKLMVTVPSILSRVPGVYVGVSVVSFVNLPSPVVFQTYEAVFASTEATEGAIVYIASSQIVVLAGPALITGFLIMVTFTVDGGFTEQALPELTVNVNGIGPV